jgi:hypothetical protein
MTERDLEEYIIKRNFDRALEYFKIQFDAITLCYKNKFINPTLILIYTTMDTLSYLDRSNDKETVKKRFIRWLDSYLLLPNSELKCSSIDLYAARCSMVHSSTAESELSKTGQAKEIYYSLGYNDNFTDIIERQKKGKKIVVVKLPVLFLEFYDAYCRYIKTLTDDTDKIALFIKRVDKLMISNDDKDEFEILDIMLPPKNK